MIYVMILDSENQIHETQAVFWGNAILYLDYMEKTFTFKQVFLTEHKHVRDNKIKEWEKLS